MVDPNGFYTGVVVYNHVIVFNRKANLTRPGDWPDLAKPEYQGQVEIVDPAGSGATFLQVAGLFRKYGNGYFKSLKQRGVSVVQSPNTVVADVASGQFAAGITLDALARPLIQKGASLDLIWPAAGAVPVPGPAAVVRGTARRAGAQQFIDWLLSTPGQQLLGSIGYTPVSPALAAAAFPERGKTALSVDVKQALTRKQEILDQFAAIFPR
jgi:iron(III) transport system substrate-binding protein